MPKKVEPTLAFQLKDARTKAGFSQLYVERETGVTAMTLRNIESGKISPNSRTLIILSKLYKYTFSIDGRAYDT